VDKWSSQLEKEHKQDLEDRGFTSELHLAYAEISKVMFGEREEVVLSVWTSETASWGKNTSGISKSGASPQHYTWRV